MNLFSTVSRTGLRSFSLSSQLSRQKIPYATSYAWLRDVHKSRQRAKYPWIPREPPTSCMIGNTVYELPEMKVELVVPNDLDSCDIKPYVAWRANIVTEPPLDSKSLFEKRYAGNIRQLYEEGVSAETIMSKLK